MPVPEAELFDVLTIVDASSVGVWAVGSPMQLAPGRQVVVAPLLG